jgi:hypothetical protein
MKANKKRPLVYFGSFQDLLGRKNGQIKAKNEWLHWVNWDLVIFDEYHFGAWRDNAKELFEGEDDDVAKKELAAEYASVLESSTRDSKRSPARSRTSCPSPRGPTSTSPGRRSRRLRQASSSRSRSSTGPTPTSSAPSSSSQRSARGSGTRTQRSRRCGSSPTRCPTS